MIIPNLKTFWKTELCQARFRLCSKQNLFVCDNIFCMQGFHDDSVFEVFMETSTLSDVSVIGGVPKLY